VSLVPGRVYSLRTAGLVRRAFHLDEATARFRGPRGADDEPGWVVASTSALTLEVAAPPALTPAELWQAVGVLGRRGSELVVGIDPGRVPGFAGVKPVTLEAQQWRWLGRQLTTHFPYEALDGARWDDDTWIEQPAPDAWDAIQAWDGTGFGDRPDADRRVFGAALTGPPWAAGAADPDGVRLVRGVAMHQVDLAAEPRALYLRYRATAASRYAGLMTERHREASAVRGSWRRVLVKNRRRARLARPKIRFILPLTQPAGPPSADGVAPLIAVVDETWSEVAGLVERLECQLAEARYAGSAPVGADPIPSAWPEYGFDPIETGSIALARRDAGGAVVMPPELDPHRRPTFSTGTPPFGLTFDVGVRVGRPVASCFEISTRATAGVLRPGAFAKLRFRKCVEPRGSVAAVTEPSEWTDPYWVQLAADFSAWRVDESIAGESAVVSVDALRVDADGAIVRWSPGPPARRLGRRRLLATSPMDAASNLRRSLLLLVTRVVREADGARVSELPLSLGQFGGGDAPAWQTSARLTGRLRVRLLEVEHHALGRLDGHLFDPARSLSEQSLWQALFGERPDHQRARLVRVSPPIEMEDPS
jgi:hypothetical protein